MSCISRIISHIAATPVGQPFCTRDCLKYGTRSAVDKALSRLVNLNLIVRLAYGVFMKMELDTRLPSVSEIARVKSMAFGRELVEYGGNLARQFGLPSNLKDGDSATYCINGSTTSFRYLSAGVRIVLRSASKKRIYLRETPQGKVVRALWHLGKENCTLKHVDKVVTGSSVPKISELLALSKAWMPSWLGEYFPTPDVFTLPNAFDRDVLYEADFSAVASP